VAVVQSDTSIGETSIPVVEPGAIVGDWSGVDPWSILGVAIAGAVLLLFGARVLRPALVLAAAMLGAILGLQLAGATREGSLPAIVQGLDIPPLAWVVGLPLLSGLTTLALARFALAAMLGGSVGTGVLLIGLGVATQGRALDGGSGPVSGDGVTIGSSPVALVADDRGSASDVDPGFDQMLDRVANEAMDRMVATATPADATGWLPRLSSVSSLVPAGLADWWTGTTAGIPAGTVDLVVALATVTGLCCGLLALLLPSRTAMVATAIGGGWLLSGTMVTAWARWMSDASPPTPFMTLLGWGVLTGFGLLFQSRAARRRTVVERERP